LSEHLGLLDVGAESQFPQKIGANSRYASFVDVPCGGTHVDAGLAASLISPMQLADSDPHSDVAAPSHCENPCASPALRHALHAASLHWTMPWYFAPQPVADVSPDSAAMQPAMFVV
jgi:hypothetical protein